MPLTSRPPVLFTRLDIQNRFTVGSTISRYLVTTFGTASGTTTWTKARNPSVLRLCVVLSNGPLSPLTSEHSGTITNGSRTQIRLTTIVSGANTT